MFTRRLAALVASAVFVTAAPAMAASKDVYFSGKMGLSFPGTVEIGFLDAHDVHSDAFLQAMGDVDAMLFPHFSIGGRLQLGFPKIGDRSSTLFGAGATFKGHFRPAPKLFLDPGLAILYQHVNYILPGGPSSDGLGLEAFIEAGTPLNRKIDLVGEFGFNSQIAGGTGADWVTWAPIWYLMAGLRV